MNLFNLIEQALDYTRAYAEKYSLTSEEDKRLIFISHLAHLLSMSGE